MQLETVLAASVFIGCVIFVFLQKRAALKLFEELCRMLLDQYGETNDIAAIVLKPEIMAKIEQVRRKL